MDKFNVFDELAFDAKQKLLSFCEYTPKTLSRYNSIVEMIKKAMNGTETVFSLSHIQRWLDCFTAFNNYSDYTFQRYKKIVLLNDNYNGKLNSWGIVPTIHRLMPKSTDFLSIVNTYEDYLSSCEYAEKTIYVRMSFAYGLLCYLESLGIHDVKSVTAVTISNYIGSTHFKNRTPKGVSTEIIGIKQFSEFLEDRYFLKRHSLCLFQQIEQEQANCISASKHSVV